MLDAFTDYWTVRMICGACTLLGFFAGLSLLYLYNNFIKAPEEEMPELKPTWHDIMDVPAPGSLIALYRRNKRMEFGYSVGIDDKILVKLIPTPPLKSEDWPFSIISTPLFPREIFDKWAYIDDYIKPVETLGSYEKAYQTELLRINH